MLLNGWRETIQEKEVDADQKEEFYKSTIRR
jgi:hypothetical protein